MKRGYMVSKIRKILDNNYINCIKTVTELSYDDSNKQSLCISEKKFYGYDDIVKQLNNESLSSTDIIHIMSNRIVLVEFKDGCIQDRKEYNGLRKSDRKKPIFKV